MGIRTCFISGLALALIPMISAATPTENQASLRPAIQEHKLENGLRIFTLEDHSAPLVTYEVWFRVGSGEEAERADGADHGITGLSHFFEHMMFRGTEAHPKFFDEVYALGGKLNAWTWLDSTVYWEKVPSRHLGKIIACEADRLENMDMSFLSLEPEREVVKAERLLRTDNSASGSMSELLDATAFRTHSYHWPTVGWMRDLNAITLEEAKAHHTTFYVPNNAMVVVVGDFDTQTLVKEITQAYGHLPARELPESERATEPAQFQERRDFLLKEVEASQFSLGYKVPALSHEDFPILEVIDQVLNGGKSSRLKQELIFGQTPIVSSLSSSLLPIRDPYLYHWSVKMLPGQTSEQAMEAITTAMEKLAQGSVSEEELDTAVNRLQASVIREMLTNQQRADLIGFGLLTADNPYLYFDRLGLYSGIDAEDIQRVAKKYLSSTQRTVITALSPERIQAHAKLWAEAAPSAPIDPLLLEAIILAQEKTDGIKKEMELALEEKAIELLVARSKTAIESAKNTEEADAIRAYMAENEKGNITRSSNLAEERTGHQANQELLATRTSDLETALHKVSSKDRLKSPEKWGLAQLFAGQNTEKASLTLLDSKKKSSSASSLLSLWLETQNRSEEAGVLRSDILGKPAETALDIDARSLAYDSMRHGVLPRSETLGGR